MDPEVPNDFHIIDTDFNELKDISSLSSFENEDKSEQDEGCEAGFKPTFRNAWHAKKRLQAFSLQKQIPTSPLATKNKLKTIMVHEKTYNEKGELQDMIVPLKKPPKKMDNPLDKAKAVVEEIELLKKFELSQSIPVTIEEKFLAMSGTRRSRSRSKSSERDFIFRKREKKVRNYRRSDNNRRSPSPVITQAKDKVYERHPKYKNPKNWEEFVRDKWNFDKKLSHTSTRNSKGIINDITRQLLFEVPAEPIKEFFYKDEKGEDVLVPYQCLRYTTAKPRVPFNVNIKNIHEHFLKRQEVLSKTNKDFTAVLEKFLQRNSKAKLRTTEPIGQRNWYQKNWKDNNESKILETSIGLSFLQNYSDDDDEEEIELPVIEEIRPVEKKPVTKINSENLKTQDNQKCTKVSTPEKKIEVKRAVQVKDEPKNSLKTDKKPTEIPLILPEKELKRNRTKSESLYDEKKEHEDTVGSWTPEKIAPVTDDMWEETPKKKKEKLIQEERKVKKKNDPHFEDIEQKQRAREIHSADEWDETPKRKTEKSILKEFNTKKIKKKKTKKKSDSEPSSPNEKKKSKKKKKNLIKKRKQKEREKKARKKKEKLKAEKLRLKKEKKKRQKEKEQENEREILKKLKKEIEHNLEVVEREEMENRKQEEKIVESPPVKVKIEKKDDYEKVRPAEDLRNFLDKKVGKVKDLREIVQEKKLSSQKAAVMEEETIKHKEVTIKHKEVDKKQSKEKRVKEVKKEKLPKKNKQVKEKRRFHQVADANLPGIEPFLLEENVCPEPTEVVVLEKIAQNEVEVKPISPKIPEQTEEVPVKDEKLQPKVKSKDGLVCESTPDTDEYHSNWESDEGISPIVKMTSKKADRSWESDEEVFDRSFSKKDVENVEFVESPVLEMPLHIKKFSRRDYDRRESKTGGSRSRTRSPEYLDVDSEIKLLEEERINLSKERMNLEMERIRIHELERKKSMEEIEYITGNEAPTTWVDESFRKKTDKKHSRWDLREDHVDSSTSKEKKQKIEDIRSKSTDKVQEHTKPSKPLLKIDTSYSSTSVLSISSSPEITSTKSPTPTVLENAYQEFMKAVSAGDDSKDFLVISSTDSEMPDSKGLSTSAEPQKKTRLTRSERDRKRGRSVRLAELQNEEHRVVGTTDPKILQEILLPGEVPISEIPMPLPMPVPSPKLDVLQNLTPTAMLNVITTSLVHEPLLDLNTALEVKNIPLEVTNLPHELEHPLEVEHPPLEVEYPPLEVDYPLLDVQVSPPQCVQETTPTKKPFSFSTLVLPSKKSAVLERSNWKVDEDSDDGFPPNKKTLEEIKLDYEQTQQIIQEEVKETRDSIEGTKKVQEATSKIETKVTEKKHEETRMGKNVSREKDRRKEVEDRRKDVRSTKRRHSRSKSPIDSLRDKRRKEDELRKKEEEKRRRDAESRRKEEDARKRDEEAKRRDRGKRRSPPQRHREPSPRRRRISSPQHAGSFSRHRSPPRRQDRRSDRGERRSPIKSSPPRRRRTPSPPKQSSAFRRRSPSPMEKSPRYYHYSRRSKSPGHSPMDGLKRSVADSTISDDLLPQPYMGESSNSPLSSSTVASTSRRSRVTSPKRPSLDERINQVLGIETQQPVVWKPAEPVEYVQQHNIAYPGYPQQQHLPVPRPHIPQMPSTTSKVLQVGNILQVVPTEEICLPPPIVQCPTVQKIVQVGNMLQIVPTEMEVILPSIPPPPPPKESPPLPEEIVIVPPPPEKQSVEAILGAKNAERVKKRQEKEERKKEKERKKKEKDKRRKLKLKISTEDLIKRALEMDGLISNEDEDLLAAVPEIISDTPGLDPSKSILSTSLSRNLEDVLKGDTKKSVQFADGIRPGEGTSPSGGEELSSPPPQTETMTKPKKYRKVGAAKKKKRKIKVKVIKKRPLPFDSDEEYENLPPPSPPPGSPPPHVFPPRVKVHAINNIPQHYLSSFGVSTAPQQPMLNQPHPGINVGYPTPTTPVYRPPPPPVSSHMNVIGQHYPRTGHGQTIGNHMHHPPQHVHSHQSTQISHHQPYGPF